MAADKAGAGPWHIDNWLKLKYLGSTVLKMAIEFTKQHSIPPKIERGIFF